MGTRADFYVGRGEHAEWIGSIAWDGHLESIANAVKRATTEASFREAVAAFFDDDRDDVTRPEDGWPWPWEDSQTTDYSYAFEDGICWGTSFGHGWWDAAGAEPDDDDDVPKVVFPNMKERKNCPALGSKRSGVMLIGG